MGERHDRQLDPAISPTCRAHMPAAFTRIPASSVPWSVSTSHPPPGRARSAVTRVWRSIRTPRSRATAARAFVTLLGSTYRRSGSTGAEYVGHVEQRAPLEDRLASMSSTASRARALANDVTELVIRSVCWPGGCYRPREAGGLAVVGLERAVELEAVAEQPGEVPARVELRAQAGGMPGGAARELALLEHDDVGQPSSVR